MLIIASIPSLLVFVPSGKRSSPTCTRSCLNHSRGKQTLGQLTDLLNSCHTAPYSLLQAFLLVPLEAALKKLLWKCVWSIWYNRALEPHSPIIVRETPAVYSHQISMRSAPPDTSWQILLPEAPEKSSAYLWEWNPAPTCFWYFLLPKASMEIFHSTGCTERHIFSDGLFQQ